MAFLHQDLLFRHSPISKQDLSILLGKQDFQFSAGVLSTSSYLLSFSSSEILSNSEIYLSYAFLLHLLIRLYLNIVSFYILIYYKVFNIVSYIIKKLLVKNSVN